MRRIVEKPPLTHGALAHETEQSVQGRDDSADLGRHVANGYGRQIVRRAARNLILERAQRRERPVHAEPDQRQDQAEHDTVGGECARQDPRAHLVALGRRLAHRHGESVVAGVGPVADEADRHAGILGVDLESVARRARRVRQIRIAGDERSVGGGHAKEHGVLGIGAHDRERIGRQRELEAPAGIGFHVRGDRERIRATPGRTRR